MKKSAYLPTKIAMASIVMLAGLTANSAWAVCNLTAGFVIFNSGCRNTINNTETGLATTNSNLATTNANLTAGDAATLADSKAYTDTRAFAVGADTLKAANAYTDTRATETLKSANAFTSEQVTKLDTKTAGGVAAIAAMASVPQLTAGKNLSVGVGVGSYDGKSAISVGVHKRINESMTARFNLATGMGSGAKPVIGAGAAWEF